MFDATSVLEKDWPELENLVIFGKGLCWCDAHGSKTSNEECRKPETADLRDTPPTGLWRDERDGSRVATLPDPRTEGEALEVVRGAEREPGLEQWPRLAALYDPPAAGRSLDDSRQILSPPKVAKFRPPLARSSSL